MNMTYHCAVERKARIDAIDKYIGRGQIVKTRFVNNCYNCLTDTGIVMIKAADNVTIVTMYVAAISDLYFIYQGQKKIPPALHKKVAQNQTRYIKNGKTIWE